MEKMQKNVKIFLFAYFS